MRIHISWWEKVGHWASRIELKTNGLVQEQKKMKIFWLRSYSFIVLFLLVGQLRETTVQGIAGENGRQGNGGRPNNSAGEKRGNSSTEFAGVRRAVMVVERYGNVSGVGEVEVYRNGVRIGKSSGMAQFTFVGSRVRVGDVIGIWCGSDEGMNVGISIVLKMGHVYWRSGDSGIKCAWGAQQNGNWSRNDFSGCAWDDGVIVHDSVFSGTVMNGAKFVWARDAPVSASFDVGCRFVIGGEVCPSRN